METTQDERDEIRLGLEHSPDDAMLRMLNDADRLAAIERDVKKVLEMLGDYPDTLTDPLDVENLRDRLCAILDPPEGK